MKKEFLIATVFSLFTSVAFAAPNGGVDGGGGGKSVVCRNSSGKITSAQTLDLYEAKNVYRLSLANHPGKSAQISTLIQDKLTRATGPNGYNFTRYFELVNKIMKFVPADAVIKPIDDAAEVVLPKDCQLEQLAHYVDDETLLVSQEIWNHLSETERAALIAHEAIYRMDRDFGAKNSRRARRIVANLFSTFEFENINAGIPVKAQTCATKQNGRMTYQFSYFPSEDGAKTSLQFQWFEGHPVLSKKTASLPVALPWMSHLPDSCNGRANCPVAQGDISSKFEGVGTLNIARGLFQNEMEQGAQNQTSFHESFYIDSPTGRHELTCFPDNDENVVSLMITSRDLLLVPANIPSCYARRTAPPNSWPEADVPGSYFEIPRLLFRQTNPRRELNISSVTVSATDVDGVTTSTVYGGDQLAALTDTWWNHSDKVATIPPGTILFGTDCPLYAGGFDKTKPYAGTGFVKVFGYERDIDTNEVFGVKLEAPITVSGSF